MGEKRNAVGPARIVSRRWTDADDLSDPRRFAWEVLRRRGDYIGVPARIMQVRDGMAPITLIEAKAADSRWGLLFRGGGGPTILYGADLLGSPP